MAKAPEFQTVKAEYRSLWNAMKTDAGKEESITAAAKKVIASRKRYEAVAKRCGPNVPWEFIGITHLMEAGGDFACHPHNGDKLTARTWQEPKNRPAAGSPPFTWEESAYDCYGILKKLGDVPEWSVERTLYLAELFNGMGYRLYHPDDKTPYLWARTNHNDGTGKYVSDGKYDRAAPSEGQCGFAPVLKEVWRLTGKTSDGAIDMVAQDKADMRTAGKIGAAVIVGGGAVASTVDSNFPWLLVLGLIVAIAAAIAGVAIWLKRKG